MPTIDNFGDPEFPGLSDDELAILNEEDINVDVEGDPNLYAQMKAGDEINKADELGKRLEERMKPDLPDISKQNSSETIQSNDDEIFSRMAIAKRINKQSNQSLSSVETKVQVDAEIKNLEERLRQAKERENEAKNRFLAEKKSEEQPEQKQRERVQTSEPAKNPAQQPAEKSEQTSKEIQKELQEKKTEKRVGVLQDTMKEKNKELAALYVADVIPDKPGLSEKEKSRRELFTQKIDDWEYQGARGASAMYWEYMVEVKLKGEGKPEAIQKFKDKLHIVLGEEFDEDHDKIINSIKEHVVEGEIHLTLMRAQAIAQVDKLNGTNFYDAIVKEMEKGNGDPAAVMQAQFEEIQGRAELPEDDPLRLKINPELMKLLVSLFVVVVGKKIYNSLFQREKAADTHVEYTKEKLAKLVVLTVAGAALVNELSSLSEDDKQVATNIIKNAEEHGGQQIIASLSNMSLKDGKLYGEINGQKIYLDGEGSVYLVNENNEIRLQSPDAPGFDSALQKSIAQNLGVENLLENKRTQTVLNHLAKYSASDPQFATQSETIRLTTLADIVTGSDGRDHLQAIQKFGLENPEPAYVMYVSLWLDQHKMLLSQTGDMAEKGVCRSTVTIM